FAITSYPVQPQRLLLIYGWFLFLGIIALTVGVFVMMERDAIMSRITKSNIGKLDWNWDFLSRLVIYGIVPLLALISVQFPDVGRAIFAWLDPFLRVLH